MFYDIGLRDILDMVIDWQSQESGEMFEFDYYEVEGIVLARFEQTSMRTQVLQEIEGILQ